MIYQTSFTFKYYLFKNSHSITQIVDNFNAVKDIRTTRLLKIVVTVHFKTGQKNNSQWCRFRANYLLSLGKLNSFVEFSQKVTFSACRFNFVQEEHYDQKSVSKTKYRRHFRFVFKFMILWKYLEEKNIWKERRIRKKVTLTIFLLFPQ